MPKPQLSVLVVTSHVTYLVSVPVNVQNETVSSDEDKGKTQDDVAVGTERVGYGGV
jgi:hypothetical protein